MIAAFFAAYLSEAFRKCRLMLVTCNHKKPEHTMRVVVTEPLDTRVSRVPQCEA